MQNEQREDGPLLGAAERQTRPVRGNLQRAEDAELELVRGSTVPRGSRRSKGREVRVGPGRPAPHVCERRRDRAASAALSRVDSAPALAEPLAQRRDDDGAKPVLDDRVRTLFKHGERHEVERHRFDRQRERLRRPAWRPA